MSAYRRCLQREIRFLRHSRWDLGLIVLGPLLLIGLIAVMLTPGSIHRLPVAVVDADQSALSRQIVAKLSAAPALDIAARPASRLDAQPLVRSGKVWAVIYLPEGLERRITRLDGGAQVFDFYNDSFLSLGSSISQEVSSAVGAAVQDATRQALRARGLPAAHLATPSVEVRILFNATRSYELFLEPLIDTAVLHLLLALAVTAAVGRELRDKRLGEWIGEAGGSVGIALLGKLTPYAVVFAAWGVVWLGWLVLWRGWAIAGSGATLLLGQALLYLAYCGVAAMVVALAGELSMALSAAAIYGGSALSFSDSTLPVHGAPLFTRIWSQMLPYTAYVRLQMEQLVIGSPLSASMPELLILTAAAAGCFVVAAVVLRWRWRRQRPGRHPDQHAGAPGTTT